MPSASSARLATITRHIGQHHAAARTPLSDPLALRGIKVIELGTVVAAPAVAAQMADHGANVIKVEIPTGMICLAF